MKLRCRTCGEKFQAGTNRAKYCADHLVTWHDAKYAEGIEVAEWFEQNVNVKSKDETTKRRLYEWKVGGTASFLCIDRMMVLYNRHPSELPDELWLAERPDREPHDKRVYEALPPQKMCAGCGEPISYRKPDGRMRGPKGYAAAKYCKRECSWRAQVPSDRSRITLEVVASAR